MGLGNLFKLAKLTIESYSDVERSKKLMSGPLGSNTLEVMYNPETLTIRHESAFQGLGNNGVAIWSHSRGKDLTVKLVFDGTNVGYFGIELLRHVPTVGELVKSFLALCYDKQAESHEPSYLRLRWSDEVFGLAGFECRLHSVDIHYTAFDRDGSPLRAELTARFVEALDPPKKDAKEAVTSPDLTHRRVVRSGDTLPMLCREIYGSANHYLRVAQVNELDDFRNLTPGEELIFPPFARKVRD